MQQFLSRRPTIDRVGDIDRVILNLSPEVDQFEKRENYLCDCLKIIPQYTNINANIIKANA